MTAIAGHLLVLAVMGLLLAGLIRARLVGGCRYWAPLNYRGPRRPPRNSLPHGQEEKQDRATSSFPNASRAFDRDALSTSRHR